VRPMRSSSALRVGREELDHGRDSGLEPAGTQPDNLIERLRQGSGNG
jgi:hypothetical protein